MSKHQNNELVMLVRFSSILLMLLIKYLHMLYLLHFAVLQGYKVSMITPCF